MFCRNEEVYAYGLKCSTQSLPPSVTGVATEPKRAGEACP
jgi:hypothetical protein